MVSRQRKAGDANLHLQVRGKPRSGCVFSGDMAGLKLPTRFKPWRAVGAVPPDKEPPYKLSRGAIEAASNEHGFQLFRLSKKD
jgi:hypothetical protein